MRISALVAAFDAEPYVAAAIDSMLAQTLPACEIIAVDDGSRDGTRRVLRGYGDRIRRIELPHGGAPRALNAALAVATGEALAFNDADDLWAPDKLAVQVAALAAAPELDAVFGAVQQFVSPDWSPHSIPHWPGGGTAPAAPQPGCHKIGMLIRRPAFARVGPFDTAFQYCDFGDWYARALHAGLRQLQHPEIVAFRRLHAGNTGRIHRAAVRHEHLLALKRALDTRRGIKAG
jgi:glycosyltransferase involved in cell wall biosynthesis